MTKTLQRSRQILMFRAVGALALVVLIIVSVSGCSQVESVVPSPTPTEEAAIPSCSAETALCIGVTDTESYDKQPSLLNQTGFTAADKTAVIAAVRTINENKGVLGKPVGIEFAAQDDTEEVFAAQPTAMVVNGGADTPEAVLKNIEKHKVLSLSAANTIHGLHQVSAGGYLFNLAPSQDVVSRSLAQLATGKGQRIGVFSQNTEDCQHTANELAQAVKTQGGTVVSHIEYDPMGDSLDSKIQEMVAAQPDVIVVISPGDAQHVLPLFLAAGVEPDRMIVSDEDTVDYSPTFPPGALQGLQGVLPGREFDSSFVEEMKQVDPDFQENSTAQGAYDATVLLALAAVSSGKADSEAMKQALPTIAENPQGVKCGSFSECADLIKSGETVDYQGVSNVSAFNAEGNIEGGSLAFYEYDSRNVPIIKGSIKE